MWRNHNGDLDAARLGEGWTQDLKLFEINSRYEFHYKREHPNKFDEEFGEKIFKRYDALLNAGYRVYLIGGTDFHGAKGSPQDNHLFFQTGIVMFDRWDSDLVDAGTGPIKVLDHNLV